MNAQKYPEVVAVGHLCMDNIFLCEDFPAENSSKHILSYSRHSGGTACQAIVALSRLGVPTGYMSPLGDDEIGKTLYQECEREGVDLSFCQVVPGVTSHFTNVLVNVKRNTRTFLSYHGKFPPMRFGREEREYLAHAELLHLDNTQNANALAAARIAKEHDVTVSLDGSSMDKDPEKNWELAKMADILITNENYPMRLTGIDDQQEALLEMERRLAPKVLIATNGGKGCVCVQDGKVVTYPAYQVRVVDTTGAGDVFHGAFLYGYLHHFDLERCIQFSSAMAAMSCGAVGGRDGIPTLEEVSQFMERHTFA